MAYTDIDDPSAFFQTKIYTGTDASPQAFTLDGNSDLQPDWVWIKNRGYANKHVLFDSVRGVEKSLTTNSTAVEVNQNADGGYLSAFNSDGFTLTEGSGSDNDTNDNRYTYVAWNWKAGSSTSTNTSGNGPDTTINVNQTAGFSIVTWTGNGDAHTFGHGLGANADFVIVKNREDGSVNAWYVNHISVANTKALYLNTNAQETSDGIWGNSAPDSTTFKFDTDNTDDFVAYCFSAKQGYSKFGSYIGNNNNDGTFVHLGFKPAFVMVKIIDTQTDNWIIQDNKRNTTNLATSQRLRANTDGAEFSSSNEIDLLSNGFKCHGADGEINGSGAKYIYMAFAEQPFVTSTGIPATAR